ncbi:MAG: hypothetical protein ACLGGZ_01225, partial [Alphaproteobacteria bacterium]
ILHYRVPIALYNGKEKTVGWARIVVTSHDSGTLMIGRMRNAQISIYGVDGGIDHFRFSRIRNDTG